MQIFVKCARGIKNRKSANIICESPLAQCSKGRTELKINVLLFGSNDLFCSINELLHQKKHNIYEFKASNQDFFIELFCQFYSVNSKTCHKIPFHAFIRKITQISPTLKTHCESQFLGNWDEFSLNWAENFVLPSLINWSSVPW